MSCDGDHVEDDDDHERDKTTPSERRYRPSKKLRQVCTLRFWREKAQRRERHSAVQCWPLRGTDTMSSRSVPGHQR